MRQPRFKQKSERKRSNDGIRRRRAAAATVVVKPPPRLPAEIEYGLRPFDPGAIRDYSSMIVCGGRRTGKSFCMRDIVYHLRKRVYDCYVFSGTRDEEHPWEKYTPEKYVTYVQADFPNDDLQAKLDNQKVRKEIAESHGVKCPPSLIIFEDLEFLSKPMWKHQSIREVFLNGRWDKTFAIAAVQYLNRIELSVRSMMDYAVFMMENNASVRDRIWKQFCGILPTMQEFETVFMQCTEEHKCLVVDCRSTSYKVDEMLFWYKASDRGFYHIGVPDVWDERVDIRNRKLVESKQGSAFQIQQQQQQSKAVKRSGKRLVSGRVQVNLKKN